LDDFSGKRDGDQISGDEMDQFIAEIVAAITGSGQTPTSADLSQFLKAIQYAASQQKYIPASRMIPEDSYCWIQEWSSKKIIVADFWSTGSAGEAYGASSIITGGGTLTGVKPWYATGNTEADKTIELNITATAIAPGVDMDSPPQGVIESWVLDAPPLGDVVTATERSFDAAATLTVEPGGYVNIWTNRDSGGTLAGSFGLWGMELVWA